MSCARPNTPMKFRKDMRRRMKRSSPSAKEGAKTRYPEGMSAGDSETLSMSELALIESWIALPFFSRFTRSSISRESHAAILCQGRGSAANSLICYCLGITDVSARTSTIFCSSGLCPKERGEPPDIDVDFEHERREEVIQHIYEQYGRERAALTATVISLSRAQRDPRSRQGFRAFQGRHRLRSPARFGAGRCEGVYERAGASRWASIRPIRG